MMLTQSGHRSPYHFDSQLTISRPHVNPELLTYPCVTLLPHLGGLTSGSMKVSGTPNTEDGCHARVTDVLFSQNHAEIALQRADAFFKKHEGT